MERKMSDTEDNIDAANDKNVKDTVVGTDTASKTKEIIAAAKARNRLEQVRAEATGTADNTASRTLTPEDRENRVAAAEKLASVNVQTRANTLTGVIDPEAMGDVKGDGGDAKNYDDSDPAKRFGVPVYEHGLGETNTASPSNDVLMETRIDAQTNAEIEAGRAALAGRSASSAAEQSGTNTRTFVTDAEPTADPDADPAAPKKTTTKK